MTSISFPQMGKVHDTLVEKGATSEIVQNHLIGKGILADVVEATVSGTLPVREKPRELLGLGPLVLKIVMDYTMNFADMIKAGEYNWTNDNITEKRFKVVGEGKKSVVVELIHFNRVMDSDKVEKKFEKAGLRAGTIEELLAFGATFSETQRRFPIVALGSVAEIGGYRHVACLRMVDDERYLDLCWWGDVWRGVCRFLAVRK